MIGISCGMRPKRDSKKTQEAWHRERKPVMEKNTTLSGIDANTLKEIQRLLRQNRKIQAIVIYRQAKDCGVRVAKEDIDREAEFLGV